MVEDVQEGKRGVPERSTKAKQQASNRSAQPEREGVELRNPAKA